MCNGGACEGVLQFVKRDIQCAESVEMVKHGKTKCMRYYIHVGNNRKYVQCNNICIASTGQSSFVLYGRTLFT
jgi:predicted nucleic acid-binding Zn finger protein